MNLKAAARRLGLHYQTAYRHVRSGELVAVKLGATYEVSEAAIEQFRRHRDELSTFSSDDEFSGEHDQHAAASPLETLRADLGLMLNRTTLSAQPVFDRIVRHAINEIGDGCVLRLLADDGVALRTAAIAHLDPTAHTLLAAIQDSPLPLSLDDHELQALRDGDVQRVDFLRQDAARRMIPREFLQYGDQLRFFGLLAMPVRSAAGAVVGLLTITRSRPGWAFDDRAEECARELANWAAAAHARLATARAGWKARSSIHRAVEVVLAIDPTQLAAQLDSLLSGLADVSVGAAALSTDGTLIAANAWFGPEFASVIGDTAAWDRLLSGDTDFLDTQLDMPDSRVDAHWAVAKRPDATPQVIIVTCTRAVLAQPTAATATTDATTYAVAS